ncbi:MAG: cbb3-type cytochrome oxidase subunit 3 [Gammaproteobacteria bacterium]
MDAGTWRGVFTILMLLLFVGICFWTFSAKRTKDFEEASQLPLEDDDKPTVGRAPDPGSEDR